MICGEEYLGNRMGLVKINQIEPGMVLAEDLKDRKDRFLLPGGASLTTKHIKTLKMWGVIEANIEGIVAEDVEDTAISKIDPATIEMAEKIVHERFYYSNIDSFINYMIVILRFLSHFSPWSTQRPQSPPKYGGGL